MKFKSDRQRKAVMSSYNFQSSGNRGVSNIPQQNNNVFEKGKFAVKTEKNKFGYETKFYSDGWAEKVNISQSKNGYVAEGVKSNKVLGKTKTNPEKLAKDLASKGHQEVKILD